MLVPYRQMTAENERINFLKYFWKVLNVCGFLFVETATVVHLKERYISFTHISLVHRVEQFKFSPNSRNIYFTYVTCFTK